MKIAPFPSENDRQLLNLGLPRRNSPSRILQRIAFVVGNMTANVIASVVVANFSAGDCSSFRFSHVYKRRNP